ncbi:polysaccharide deacetylase family protein [Alkalithermobacter paradoxus]|uniref:Peptidoglycan-N-acetylmuramic acid deacetylase PdaC n=1 Tax=Alkalithermobacter paradoxus TaxID=29349 RepID=A0A1V4I8H2_9FIRM|nr:peptidoglycan-N-acetylmuramic acid deacetylase PdaC [[Clostridium] thermoalcaliphilum]
MLIITHTYIKNQLLSEVGERIYNDPDIIRNGVEDQKVVALTFDDGPHPRFTPKILDLLAEYDAKATFFVIGKHVKLYPKIVERIVSGGHEIGNHTFTHINVTKSSYGKIKKEFEDTQNIIFTSIGMQPKIFRPPFGSLNNNTLRIVREGGCKVILWSPNQDPKDWDNPSAEEIAEHILKNIGNGNVILLHDYVIQKDSKTVEALRIILPELVERGYRLITISELLEISGL